MNKDMKKEIDELDNIRKLICERIRDYSNCDICKKENNEYGFNRFKKCNGIAEKILTWHKKKIEKLELDESKLQTILYRFMRNPERKGVDFKTATLVNRILKELLTTKGIIK